MYSTTIKIRPQVGLYDLVCRVGNNKVFRVSEITYGKAVELSSLWYSLMYKVRCKEKDEKFVLMLREFVEALIYAYRDKQNKQTIVKDLQNNFEHILWILTKINEKEDFEKEEVIKNED